MPNNQLKKAWIKRLYVRSARGSVIRPLRVKRIRGIAKRPIDTNSTTNILINNLTDFVENAGLRRNRPRTNTTYAAMIITSNPVFASDANNDVL